MNLSPVHLADAPLADRLVGMVQGRGQEARRFVFEFDEVALARASAAAFAVLTRLRVKGFGLSMRQTSAGSSWTHQLGRVPLSELKLDRPFVNGAGQDPKRLAMLESVLASARDVGLPVVAAGCDSREDFDTLLSLGCSEAQGRFVAEPMQAADTVAWALTCYQQAGPGASR